MLLLSERIQDIGGKIIGTIHDQKRRQIIQMKLATILRDTMNEAGSVYFKEILIDVEVEVKIANGRAEK